MRIGIDCSALAKAERTGVARYCASLLGQLPHVVGEEDRVLLLYRLSRLKRRRWFERVDDPRFSLSLFDDRVPALRRKVDVVHGPDLRIPRFKGVPCVSTVHDLSALDLPGIASESFKERKRQALEDVATRATVILCISPYTETAFLNRYPQAEGRTRIVPSGISGRFRPQAPERVDAVLRRLGIGRRYLLFVGQVSARKNLGPLVEAFGRLHERPDFGDVELVFAGPVQRGGEEILERARAGRFHDRVHFLGFVDDEVLPALYSAALAFVFTSKAEGFGLPVLEAMACDCPVIAVDAGAITSTAGGAAVIVDPDDPDELHGELVRVLEESGVREDLIRRGRAWSEGFSWRQTARKTVEAYRDAVALGVLA